MPLATIPLARERAFIERHRIARMATADKHGAPHVVPICYAYDNVSLFSAVDQKPKRRPIGKLKRLRNIRENPAVSVVIDDYDDDWSKLAFVIIQGNAQIIEDGADYRRAIGLLTRKYAQYRQAELAGLGLPVIKIIPTAFAAWGAV